MVHVTGNLEEGNEQTARRPGGRGRVISVDQCRLDLTFSVTGLDDIQLSVWVSNEIKSNALAAINRLPTNWFRLSRITNVCDTFRIFKESHPQEMFRLYPVLRVESKIIIPK